MNKNYITLILQSVVLIILQIILFRNVVLFNVAFCFIYIGIILYLPVETDRILALLIGFLLGFFIDVFYNSFGIHAAVALLLSLVRFYWISALAPQGGYEGNVSLNTSNMGLQWFTSYAFPLIFIHHFALFFIETGGFSHFGFTLLKVLVSSLFTFVVFVLIQLLFFSRKKRI